MNTLPHAAKNAFWQHNFIISRRVYDEWL